MKLILTWRQKKIENFIVWWFDKPLIAHNKRSIFVFVCHMARQNFLRVRKFAENISSGWGNSPKIFPQGEEITSSLFSFSFPSSLFPFLLFRFPVFPSAEQETIVFHDYLCIYLCQYDSKNNRRECRLEKIMQLSFPLILRKMIAGI